MSMFKAAAHMRELKQRLGMLLPASTLSDNVDSDGMPLLVVKTNSEYENIKIYVDGNADRVDGLGLPQKAYSPHICQVVQESAAPAGSAEAIARAKILSAVAKLGMKIILEEAASAGAAASWADALAAVAADAGAITAVIPSDEINPLTMSQ